MNSANPCESTRETSIWPIIDPVPASPDPIPILAKYVGKHWCPNPECNRPALHHHCVGCARVPVFYCTGCKTTWRMDKTQPLPHTDQQLMGERVIERVLNEGTVEERIVGVHREKCGHARTDQPTYFVTDDPQPLTAA